MTDVRQTPWPLDTGHSRVYERDTDALFLKLLRSRVTAIEVVARETLVTLPDILPTVRGQVRHDCGSGSIDLEVSFRDGPVFLIENKIDAAYSTTREGRGQPQRYATSVDARRRAGQDARSVLLAPARYLTGSRLAGMFDVQLAYEAFRSVVEGSDRTLLEAAIRQAETPYEPVANLRSSDFFAATRQLIFERFPDLVMKHDPNAGGVRRDASRTVYFDVGRTLRAHPNVPRARMSLQCWDSAARSASVKIMLPNRAGLADKLPIPRDLADIGGYLRPAGRSLGIVVDTPRLDTQQPIAVQADEVVEALEAALRLQSWWNNNKSELQRWTS